MTIAKPLILDVGPEEFSIGLTYTAASRTPNFSNLAFAPMPSFNRILKIFTRTRFKEKEVEIKRRLEMTDAQETVMQIEDQEMEDQESEEQEVGEMEQGEGNEAGEDSEDLVASQLSNISL